MIILEKRFLSRFGFMLHCGIFFNQLFFFIVVHAYRKLTDALEWLFLKKPDTSLTLGWCVYKEWSSHWDTLHYIDSFTKRKYSTKRYGQNHDFNRLRFFISKISGNGTGTDSTYDIYTFNEAVFDRHILF